MNSRKFQKYLQKEIDDLSVKSINSRYSDLISYLKTVLES